MNTSKVALAALELKKGNYSNALLLYQSVSSLLGSHLFEYNINLCIRELKKQNKNIILNSSSIRNDELIIKKSFHQLKGEYSKELSRLVVPGAGLTLEVQASVSYSIKNKKKEKKALLLFEFFDKNGMNIKDIPGIGFSKAFEKHFRYLNSNSNFVGENTSVIFNMRLPDCISSISIGIASLNVIEGECIDVEISGRIFNAEKERLIQLGEFENQSLPLPITHKNNNAKKLVSELHIACILDEFTFECLSHEVHLIELMEQNWLDSLEDKQIDFLLVESCWKGSKGSWGTLTKGSGGARKLNSLLNYCESKNIPTVFWNKEDPPHFEKFAPIAKMFDLVITTDANMVQRYKNEFGINAHPLSFAAQAKIHNPKKQIVRKNKAVFAGSYYGDKPTRCEDFNILMDEVIDAGLDYDIFDRNHGANIEKFKFPEKYQAAIRGNLLPSDVWKAHKGYKYQINLNTVQDSPTMFARRVYESLASGTPIITNQSLGVRQLFGDIVIMTGASSVTEQIQNLEASPEAYETLARRGVRAVMKNHQYCHRIKSICDFLNINVDLNKQYVTMAVSAACLDDVKKAKRIFDCQTLESKRLFIELENFDFAHLLLNESSRSVMYAMKDCKSLYANLSEYYENDLVMPIGIDASINNEALEDFLYWGQYEE